MVLFFSPADEYESYIFSRYVSRLVRRRVTQLVEYCHSTRMALFTMYLGGTLEHGGFLITPFLIICSLTSWLFESNFSHIPDDTENIHVPGHAEETEEVEEVASNEIFYHGYPGFNKHKTLAICFYISFSGTPEPRPGQPIQEQSPG